MDAQKKVTPPAIEQIKVVESTEGFMALEIHKGTETQRLQSEWLNFYISDKQTLVEAFFGSDTGARVPAVLLLAKEKLKVGSYEIKNPDDGPWSVSAFFGEGRPGAISGDAFGKGKLNITEISSTPSAQSIKGTFEFIYINKDDVAVKVVAKEFSANNQG